MSSCLRQLSPTLRQALVSPPQRSLSTTKLAVGSYQAAKDAAKELRRQAWERHQQRLERLSTRRDNRPKDVKKNLFRSWWDKELIYHDKMLRLAKKEGKPWRIRVAVMVERLPVVTPDEPQWEKDFTELTDYLMTFGKQYPPETGFMPEDKLEDHIVMSEEEFLDGLQFTPAPRETEADHTGNVRTLDRQLKTRVYLALRTKAEGTLSGPRWTFPSTLVRKEETLLEAAQRAVVESVGKELILWCPSNAPTAVNFRVYNKNLSQEIKENYYGEKIFYYLVQWDSGDVDENSLSNDEDYAWLSRKEMVAKVEEERGKHQAKFFHYIL